MARPGRAGGGVDVGPVGIRWGRLRYHAKDVDPGPSPVSSRVNDRPPLRVAVLGAGTVGGAVVRALVGDNERLCATDGSRLVLAGVAVRDLGRRRSIDLPADLLTDAPAHLVASPDVDVIVECMGGDEPARTLIAAALGAGKAVVTANKHVIAHHGAELEALARQTASPLRFEASVGGGIPVLGPLAADLASNVVLRVRGIVNGTTNFMLTSMDRDGLSYADALEAAQAAGYAEADPSGDVEGNDAANKLVILARLAFGAWVRPEAVVVRPPSLTGTGKRGITGVTREEMAGAAALGLALKLVANAERDPGEPDAGIRLSVLPTAVSLADPLGRTNGVTNRIEIRADPLGSVAFSGPGAGGGATGSAVLGDLLAIARGGRSTWAGLAAGRIAGDSEVGGPIDGGPGRGWYAFVPSSGAVGPRAADRANGVEVAELGSGLAVHVAGRPIDDARTMFRELGAPDDLALYPVDEPAAAR